MSWLDRAYRRLKPLSVSEAQDFWKRPSVDNAPETYLSNIASSVFLYGLVRKHAVGNPSVLELGCNVGRNLNYLYHAGVKRLYGVEINSRAVGLFKRAFPETARAVDVLVAPVESVVRSYEDSAFDVVFTMAFFEHLHSDSEWVFKEVARVTKGVLITIEDERGHSWRQYPRDYRRVFERLGFKQVEAVECSGLIGDKGSLFIARVFKKNRGVV